MRSYCRTYRWRYIFLALVIAGLLVQGRPCSAFGLAGMWGSAKWFDWSDYRAAAGARIYLAKLTSGHVEKGSQSIDLLNGFGSRRDPQPMREFWATLYLDRLGFRFVSQEDLAFKSGSGEALNDVVTDLRPDSVRIGADLDIVRTSYLRAGINFDYQVSSVKFRVGSENALPADLRYIEGRNPMTLGIHGRAIPMRLKDVPVTIQARFRFPVPLIRGPADASVTEWEVSAGLRPSIWQTSVLGSSTFSAGVEVGFRSTYLNLNDEQEATLKAHWQGAFFEVGLYF